MAAALLLHLHRDVFGADATLGRLLVGGESFGFVCEDEDRGLEQTMPLDEIKRLKVLSETAIPRGTYKVSKTWSPKYRRDMYLVHDVPGFAGIRIHSGNTEDHTAGCLLPGLTRDASAMAVYSSRKAVAALEAILDEATAAGRGIVLVITRDMDAYRAYRGA
jgi:hypothetical protein